MTRWLLMAIVCAAHAPHRCKPVVLIDYYDAAGCQSGLSYLAAYPEPRQIKVWCERKRK